MATAVAVLSYSGEEEEEEEGLCLMITNDPS